LAQNIPKNDPKTGLKKEAEKTLFRVYRQKNAIFSRFFQNNFKIISKT